MYESVKKFCAALKSDEFTQTTECLSRTVGGVRCHCALGVALEVFGVPSKVYRHIDEDGFHSILDNTLELKVGDIVFGYATGTDLCEPSRINETYGCDYTPIAAVYQELSDFIYQLNTLGMKTWDLSAMNDAGSSFETIANHLEFKVHLEEGIDNVEV